MADDANEPKSYWPTLLRQMSDEQHERDLKEYGEEGLQERRKAISTVIDLVLERVAPMRDQARRRGFNYVDCRLDLRTNFMIVLRFGDGPGRYYDRSIAIEGLMNKHVQHAGAYEHIVVKSAVHYYFRRDNGFQMLEKRMRRIRVSAKE